MSKFIDGLKRVSQEAPQPMGFRTGQLASAKPRIQLLACLGEGDIDNAADYTTGADAVILRLSKPDSGMKSVQRVSENISGIPWGGWLTGDIKGTKQLVKAGCDFVVFAAGGTSLAALQDDEVGKIIGVEAAISEGLLRAVNELPVDAVLIKAEGEDKQSLTWYDLILFQRFTTLLTKPLLVSVPSNITAREIEAIWEAEVDGVVVELGGGKPEGEVKKLRKVIDELPYPAPDKQKKTDAIIPSTSRNSDAVVEVEEEEE